MIPKKSFHMHILSLNNLPVTLSLNLFSSANSKKTADGTVHGYQK